MSNEVFCRDCGGLIHLSPSLQAITDAASARDRAFFRRYPEIQVYVRPLVPGEFGIAQFPDGTTVLVVQLRKDVRTRHPLLPLNQA